MQQTGFRYKLISLVGMAVILAIAWGMDKLLAHQTKLASATFNYSQLFWISTACALILIVLWYCLGWLALFKSGYSRLIWIPFVLVGIFGLLVFYLWPYIPLGPLHRIAWALQFEYPTASLKSTTLFIAVLGLLNLALRSRSRLGG